jgi:hypothetical protein
MNCNLPFLETVRCFAEAGSRKRAVEIDLSSSLLRVDLEVEPAAQRMGQRQKDFGLQVLMAKA